MPPTNGPAETVRIAVTDFGPIGRATVDLRPLTIFLGPSNAGKSYLAMLIHALSQHMFDLTYGPGYREQRFAPSSFHLYDVSRNYTLSDSEQATLEHWIHANLSAMTQSSKSEPIYNDELTHLIQGGLRSTYENSSYFEDVLKNCFGTDRNLDFIRYRSNKAAHITVTQMDLNGMELANLDVTLTSSKFDMKLAFFPEFSAKPPADKLNRYFEFCETLLRHYSYQNESGDVRSELLDKAYDSLCAIAPALFPSLEKQAHYLPADRTGIMHAHGIVMPSLAIRAMHGGSIPNIGTPAMTGVLSEFLVNLNRRSRSSDYENAAADLEETILGGKIREEWSDGAEYPTFFYHPSNWEEGRVLPIRSTSSMISELAPVVHYLRHTVKSGQLLIIEEPESHLHPAAQAKLAVYLASLVRSGLRVLITTHSEWLLEQFSNLVRFSSLSPEHQDKIGVAYPNLCDASLHQEQVGAWTFGCPDDGRGSKVQEFKLGIDAQTMPEQYEAVMLRLYDEWQELDRLIGESPT